MHVYVSGSSKTQTLLPSDVIEISPQSFKFCNSVEKYQILLDSVATMFGFYLNHRHIYVEYIFEIIIVITIGNIKSSLPSIVMSA